MCIYKKNKKKKSERERESKTHLWLKKCVTLTLGIIWSQIYVQLWLFFIVLCIYTSYTTSIYNT